MVVNRDAAKEFGDVELPELDLKYEANLKPVLERMGLNSIFTSINSLRRLSAQGAMLDLFSQMGNHPRTTPGGNISQGAIPYWRGVGRA
jgi:hypothetical protein